VRYVGSWEGDAKEGYGKMLLEEGGQEGVLLDGLWGVGRFVEGRVNSEMYQGEYRNQTLST